MSTEKYKNEPNAETSRDTPLLQFLNYVWKEDAQKLEPSAGWGSFLCWGRAMYLKDRLVPTNPARKKKEGSVEQIIHYLLSSSRTVSMV